MSKILMTKTELSKELDLSQAMITKYCSSGLLVFKSISGKEVIDLDEALVILDANVNSKKIKEYIAKRNIGATRPANNYVGLFDTDDDEFEDSIQDFNLNEVKTLEAKYRVIATRIDVAEKKGLFITKKEVDIFAFSVGDKLKQKKAQLVEDLCSSLIDVQDELLKRKLIRHCVDSIFEEYEKELMDAELDKINKDEDFDEYNEIEVNTEEEEDDDL